jgi:hypothetical protein
MKFSIDVYRLDSLPQTLRSLITNQLEPVLRVGRKRSSDCVDEYFKILRVSNRRTIAKRKGGMCEVFLKYLVPQEPVEPIEESKTYSRKLQNILRKSFVITSFIITITRNLN